MRLAQWQSDFIEQIKTPDTHADAIYADSILLGKLSSLKVTFQATVHLIGEQAFMCIATVYCNAILKTPADIGDLGEGFPGFLITHPISKELPYLPDLTLFEWRWHLAFNSDAPNLDSSNLYDVLQLQGADSVISLRENIWLNQYDFAVDQLWRCCQIDYNGSFDVDLSPKKTTILLYRAGYKINIIHLHQDIAVLCLLVDGKRSLEEVYTELAIQLPSCSFDKLFMQCVHLGIFKE